MMNIPMFLSLFVIVTSVSAQEGTDFTTTPTPVLELKKKNEISINTAPLFRALLGAGSSEATRFSATYKRNLTCKSAFRFSIMADMIHRDSYFFSSRNGVIILQTDSIIIKQSSVSPSYVSPHVNIGYERLFGKHKLKWFYGADLTLGYYESRSYKENKTLVRDTSYGPSAWVEVLDTQADIVYLTKTKAYSIGISPFFGAKYPISKRFSISAQVGVDMTYQDQSIAETKSGITKNYRVSTFDFNQSTGILNDISLVYKF